jgi:hypothetical protein
MAIAVAGRTRAAFSATFHEEGEYVLCTIGVAEDKTARGQMQDGLKILGNRLAVQATGPLGP